MVWLWGGTVVLGQNAESPLPDAVFVSDAQIRQAVQNPTGGVQDALLRVVPVKAGYNIGISVVRRSLVKGKVVPDALQHHSISEVYHVTQGCGTLRTGGTLVGAKEMPADNAAVLTLIGPTAQGAEIKGGSTRQVGPGDVVVIPPDTPHGFSDICPDGITYVLVRVDSAHVLQPR